jgi:hypothetical protein
MTDTAARLADTLVEYGLATPDTIRPCTPAEVAEVGADHGVPKLPAQYDEFLRVMGRRAGDLLRGTDFFYPDILGLDQDGKDLLQENDASQLLPAGALVIGMHQGYELYWLSASGEVSWYKEGQEDVHRTWPTLLTFLASQAEAQLEARRSRQR